MTDAANNMMLVSSDSINTDGRNLMRSDRDSCNDEAQAFENLCESVKVNGILEPVIVRKLNDNTYKLLAGYRRVEAARTVGLEQIPVIIHAEGEEDEKNDNEIQFIENIMRKDVCPVKRGKALYSHMQKFYNGNVSAFAQQIGMRSQTLSKWLRIVKLSKRHSDAVAAGRLAYSTAIEAAGTQWSNIRDGLSVDEVLDAVIDFDITRNELREIRFRIESGDARALPTLLSEIRHANAPQLTNNTNEANTSAETSEPVQQNVEERVVADLQGFWKGIRLHSQRIHEEVVNAMSSVEDDRKEILFKELQDMYRALKSLAQQCFSDRWEELITSVFTEGTDAREDHEEQNA